MAGRRQGPGTLNEPGHRFTRPEAAAVFAIGVVGILIPGLQPQLLGALAREGQLSADALGNVATIELLMMGVAAGAAGFLLPVTRLRPIAVLAILVTALLDLTTVAVGGAGLLAARAGAGLAEGVLIWITIGLIVRTRQPGRWSGTYLLVQTLAQLGLATLFGLARLGSASSFEWLATATLIALAAVPWLPRGYAPLGEVQDGAGVPPARGLATLAGIIAYLAFVVAVWVYLEPLGLDRGIGESALGVVAPLSLGMQVLGAGLATLIAGRVSAALMVALSGTANLALLWIMATAASPQAFVAAASAFGFLWLFVLPFQVPLVIAADPSRRAATLIGGAQLVGASLGPLAAAQIITGHGIASVLWFGAVGDAIGVGLMIAFGGRTLRLLEP